MPQAFKLFICAAMTVILTDSAARGQEAPTPSLPTSPPASPAQAPTSIPLAEVVTQAESASGNLRDIAAELAANQIPTTVNKELPVLTREIDARLDESAKLLSVASFTGNAA